MGLIGYGMFCEIYGKTLRNNMLECILTFRHQDFAVSDFLEDMDISKPKAYQIVKELLEENIIEKSRVIGKTQLYRLNKDEPKTKLLIKAFNACLTYPVSKHYSCAPQKAVIAEKKRKYKKK